MKRILSIVFIAVAVSMIGGCQYLFPEMVSVSGPDTQITDTEQMHTAKMDKKKTVKIKISRKEAGHDCK